jgi:hypothetical protein
MIISEKNYAIFCNHKYVLDLMRMSSKASPEEINNEEILQKYHVSSAVLEQHERTYKLLCELLEINK